MGDGLFAIIAFGPISFWALGVLMGRWSVIEQIRDEHNLKVIEAQLKKRKNEILSAKDIKKIIEDGESNG